MSLIIYTLLAAEFIVRYLFDKPVRSDSAAPKRFAMDRGVKLMMLALGLDGVLIFIRSVYRTIELQDGWTGRIITNEALFSESSVRGRRRLLTTLTQTPWTACPSWLQCTR